MGGLTTISSTQTAQPDPEILMKQYQLMVDTYVKYLDITLKFVVFTYAVTGAILSYYLSQPSSGFIRFALLFPILLNATFAASCFVAIRWNKPIVNEIDRVIGLLNLEAYPDAQFLSYVLAIFGSLHVAITLGLLAVTIIRLLPQS